MPPSASYRPAPRLHTLGPDFFDIVEVARFPTLDLRFRNQRWAGQVGLDTLSEAEWRDAFGRFRPLPDNLEEPLSLRYHGHQFRTYNPALGDGRGVLYAQLLDSDGRLLDLGTKGTGQTPWSRGGDGRLTLTGGVREVLATEMLEALGVYTSKSFSLFETGESLIRHDEPSPTRSCVLVRLGHSHIRFGSFQRHAFYRDLANLRALARHSIESYAPELCCPGASAAQLLLPWVVERSARLCASWMAAGFVHGVLNTDNMNITGESFDYGPYRFLPTFDPTFTAAYFDHSGLYAYANQPDAVRWNLQQLAAALAPIAPDGALRAAVRGFDDAYAAALDRAVLARLGLEPRDPLRDRLVRMSAFGFLFDSQIGFERFFFDCYGGLASDARPLSSPAASAYRGRGWQTLRSDLDGYRPKDPARLEHPYFQGQAPCTLLIDEIEEIWDAIAERDDWSRFEDKIARIRVMAGGLRS